MIFNGVQLGLKNCGLITNGQQALIRIITWTRCEEITGKGLPENGVSRERNASKQ